MARRKFKDLAKYSVPVAIVDDPTKGPSKLDALKAAVNEAGGEFNEDDIRFTRVREPLEETDNPELPLRCSAH